MKNFNPNRQKQLVFSAMTALIFILAGQSAISAQTGKYKTGDRVECEVTGNLNGKYWEKGTVMDFRANDQPDGSWYRVKADSNKVEYYCRVEHIRPIAGTQTKNVNKNETKPQPEKNTRAEENETVADGDFVECPVKQKQVKNGARPDAELFKKIIRCAKGEKAVEKGDEGAVTVEISALQIGASRPWSYSQDLGNAKPGTIVHPVKATYTVKTFYRTATEVEEGWIRILNFYVNAFGEWQIGSQENVKSPKVKRIQK
jgi:hypothetical protein